MRDRLQKSRNERTDLMNKNKEYHAYEVGQIVYMYQVKGSRKIACYFVGPLVILQGYRAESVPGDVTDGANISPFV